MLLAGNAGQGRHQWNVSVAGVERVALLANILEILYPPAMFCAKFTILLQIQRIFASHQKNLIYWSIQALIGANFITYFATFVAFIFACWPREKIWNPHIPGRCISTNASIIVTSAINIISDVTILLLPLIGIKKLHLPAKKKIMVGAVFATGAFACISSIIRLVYSIQLTNTKDVTWAISPVGMWA
ncbi:integral membrane protein [Delitschia confertaspora ATCC 74209]|uniref:Integral membrane protein n=1 Tax=Delitschia confertaspora ATCC 74209 TaxID=1513339 RepID=A0A9P4MRG5_9PLEO|nr:integral membrane protein [Delitschia confertaspora ATCC 74209]